MSDVIDSLEIQISTEAGSSAVNIDALAKSLGNLRSNAGLTKVSNNLTKLAGSLTALKSAMTGMPSMTPLETMMSGLTNIQKLPNLNSALLTLKKIPEIVNSLDSDQIEQFRDRMEKLAKALDPLATKINAVAAGFAKLPSQVSKTVTATNKLATETARAEVAQGKFNNQLNVGHINMAAFVSNVRTAIQAVQSLVHHMSAAMAQGIEWDGIQARFGRAFGENAQETLDLVDRINESLKINKQEFMQYSSLFAEMLAGFGVNKADAGKMAIGYTELAYDIWAAYNDVYKTLDGEDGAIAAVRSAIAGEVEPIRRAGFTIVDSELAQTAAKHNLAYSTQKATEAQKSYLRYLTMVDQAMDRNIIGVYASEMQTAEGAVRTLSQQVKGLSQAFGSLFIPILQAVVPWISAFVQLITEAIAAVAAFFNLPFFKIDWGRNKDAGSGLENMAAGAGAAGDALGGAAKQAKKLKDYTMGFDELNVIKPDDPSAGGGGAGAGAGGGAGYDGLDVDSIWDESVFAQAAKQIDEIKEKLKKILFFAGLVGTAFALWKLVPAFVDGLNTVRAVLKAIGGNKAGLSALAFLGKEDLAKKLVAFKVAGDGLAKSKWLKKGLIPMIVGDASTIGTAMAGIGVFITSLAALGIGFVNVYKKSENFREGLSAIGDGIGWVTDKIGEFASWIGGTVGKAIDGIAESFRGIIPDGLIDVIKGVDLSIGDLLITAAGFALFGPWGLLIEGAVLAIKGIGYAAKDSLAPVDLFGEGISEVTKGKVEPFIQSMGDLDNSLKTLDWGNAIVTEDDVATISGKLKTITDTIVNELDADKNEALANINPLKGAMSEEKFAELQKKIEESYAGQIKTVQEGEAQINAIIKLAADEGRAISETEAAEIAKIQEQMKETGIKYLSESETESNLILQRLKDNASQLSAEQASEMIKSAKSAKDKTVKAAEEQYEGILLEAQRLLDTGVINKKEYDAIVKSAKSAKDKTVKDAKDQYSEILKTAKSKMGEYSKYIDDETGEILSNWNVFCKDFNKRWDEMWRTFKVLWDTIGAPLFTRKFWDDQFNKIVSSAKANLDEAKRTVHEKLTGLVDGAKNIMKKFQDWWKNLELPEFKIKKPHISWGSKPASGWIAKTLSTLGLPTDIPDLKVSWYKNGGFPSVGEVFVAREAGPELVGNIGGRSAVANNDQIVDAVSQGVYSAVMAAMRNQGNQQGNQDVRVYLDGREIYASVKKTERERGMTLFTNGVVYG